MEFLRSGNRRRPVALRVSGEFVDRREYPVAASSRLRVEGGEFVKAGEQLTEGSLNPQDVLAILGPEAVQLYLVDEVQKVYREQGVSIHDKHVEVIVRQMLRRVTVLEPGDSAFLPGEKVDARRYAEANKALVDEGKRPAEGRPELMGITKASLATESWLSAASFQETTRVLTEAAINGAKDHLIGLKENVIIGKLIPAGTGAPQNVAAARERQRREALEALAGETLEGLPGEEFNPFLEEGGARSDAAETAGLASILAETAGDASGEDFNPFLEGNGLSIRLTASVGVATLPDVAASAEELVRAADMAMYQVKDSGKNGVRIAQAE